MTLAAGDPEAIAIHSRLIEDSRAGLVLADFDLYLSCFHLPNFISTWDTATAFDTPADMRRVFDSMLAHLAALSVTRYERSCVSAHFIGGAKIEAVHESRLYDKDGFAALPAVAHSILEFIGGRWLVTVSRYEVAGAPIMQRAFGSGRPLTAEEAAKFGWGD